MSYDHKSIDAKWQKRWEEAGLFEAKNDSEKEKFYVLVEFPYPSAAGLHVGHPRSYTALDVVARKKRMEGKNVLFPMGWDAFGLPAENYAIKTGVHPSVITRQNIDTFRRQLKAIGCSFDWSREVDTTDPKYYRWTQWMFNQFFKAGLAYKAKATINWCPKDKTGLANEEVIGGTCERCGTPVEKREKEQWMIAITKYADRLIDDLKNVDYLPKIKKQQEDWIGRSEGAEIDFIVDGSSEKITVFTTRPETLFGVTYVVLSPEHPLVLSIVTAEHRKAVNEYVEEAKKKTDTEQGNEDREKTGVFTGAYAVNPINNERVPIWIADYVLSGYGEGAVMAVPAHDERDFAFAKRYGLRAICVIRPLAIPDNDRQISSWQKRRASYGVVSFQDVSQEIQQAILAGSIWHDHVGELINSSLFNDLISDEARTKVIAWLENEGVGRFKIVYKLRDWVFSRQRYWGEPIPLVHCENCASTGSAPSGWVAVPDDQLPVELPQVEKYQPTDTGESPLAAIDSFVNTTCPTCGGPAKRETDTMPNWAGSSWYFLRYVDPQNDQAFASKEALKQWMPVDLYNGGMEHTTLHLLYSRFWNKFLFDQGFVPTSEPYARRHSHGLIMSDDGTKMSKSKGNVVNPDEVVNEFGADTLRTYILFMGPFEEPVPWSTNGLIGVRRFLEKVMRLSEKLVAEESPEVTKALHKTIKKITDDIEGFRFNTAVAELMKFVNAVQDAGGISKDGFGLFLTVLSAFAPHVANELWEQIGGKGLVEEQVWPQANTALLVENEMTIVVQVNGKVRANVVVPVDISDADLIALAKADDNVQKFLTSAPKKEVVVKGKLVNLVV